MRQGKASVGPVEGALLLVGIAAMLTMSVVGTSTAEAAPLEHVESVPAIITGNQTVKHKFTTHAGTVECNVTKFTGTVSEKTFSTLTLAPEYRECTAFGLEAEVQPNGCVYVFHVVENSNPVTATVDVSCPSGKTVQMIWGFGLCTMTIGSQADLGHITLSNTGSGTTRDVDAYIAASGVKYTLSGFCPNGTGTFADGVYEGGATLRADIDEGEKAGAQQGAWVE